MALVLSCTRGIDRLGGNMTEQEFDIQAYLAQGIEDLVRDAVRATLRNPRESAWLAHFARTSRTASRRREDNEARGLHVPSFLIASITSSCNLHCAGCYSRCTEATVDAEPRAQLTTDEWADIFRQADELGVSVILLAGGEPLLRQDVVEVAGSMPDLMFPIFTNGTFMDDVYMKLLDKHRNLIPIMSIEGNRSVTDARRGSGIYDILMRNMEELSRRGLVFGASVTVTTENLDEVCTAEFVDSLAKKGCKAIIYVEFEPMDEESAYLALGDPERDIMDARLTALRTGRDDVLFISFPGDEKASGGCMAAGRGFFHINSHGGAEPCPFSPYSDINVRETSLAEALDSQLFVSLRTSGLLEQEHMGGCVLHHNRTQVEALLA